MEILIVAAEASSVLYAQRLLELWRNQKLDVKAFGVGSQEMQDLGFERFGRSEEMAVVGIAEVIEHYSDLKKVFYDLLEAARIRKPRMALIMDYPDFNLRLAKELKALGIPVIYYIAPQVWAWRQGRVKKIRDYCEEVLLLFPFELPFYQRNQVKATFVGHPLLDEIELQREKIKDIKMQRARYGFRESDLVLGLMPGSRRSELALNLPHQLDTLRIILKKIQDKSIELPAGQNLKIAILVAPSFGKEKIQQALDHYEEDLGQSLNFQYTLIKDEPFAMISLVDVMLAASGTATLMVGLLQKPMVIMYRFKALTWFIGQIIVAKYQFVGLPNLILEEEVAPESLQETPEATAELLQRFLVSSELRTATSEKLSRLKDKLGQVGVTQRVADALKKYW